MSVKVAHIDNLSELKKLFEEFEELNPEFKMGFSKFKGECNISAEYNGVKYLWIIRGRGEIYLPKGYRTKEGDGDPLPKYYVPDKLSENLKNILETLKEKLYLFSDEVPYGDSIRNCVKSILDRWKDGFFIGDITGEIAQLTPLEEGGWCHTFWSNDDEANECIRYLIKSFDEIGWSTKIKDSYEPIGVGDQIVVNQDENVKVKGNIECIWIEDLKAVNPHTSITRRVRYLKDLAGGCNISFDPFRRLPLTWYVKGITKDNPDGYNRVNSHIVNMAEEFSRTHFHPPKAIGGGKPQHELYLVLDPAEYNLKTYGRVSYAYFYPDLEDLSKYVKVYLKPGSIVYIPPGVCHRGMNVLANVVTLPGFKPQNEWYIDKKIKRLFNGKIPYNDFMISVISRYDVT